MAKVVTGYSWSNEQITPALLNQMWTSSTFNSSAVDDSTTALSGGAVIVKDAGIVAAKLASNSVTTVKILDENVTFAKLADVLDSDTMTGASATKLATSESIKAYIDKFKPNIIQAVKTDIFSILTPNNVWTDIPDLTVTITPKFSNSKILISSSVSNSTDHAHHGCMFRYVRGSTPFALGDTRGSRTPATFASGYSGQYNSPAAGMDYLDSSSVTAGTPITFKIQVTAETTVDVLINEVQTDDDADYVPSPISTLTVTEIYQ
tara:strand:- start:123 stop:911 length:789 start_codon:yes stop_codon:yes gene_type:complete